jgi:hypothetical protein
MMILASYGNPLWIDIWDHFCIPTLMAGSLVAWILLGHRWVYAYWVIVVVGLMSLAFDVMHEGWQAFLFQDRYSFVTHTEVILEGGQKATCCTVRRMVGGPVDQLDFPAKLADWAVALLSLSAPFWIKWVRRKLGLKDN